MKIYKSYLFVPLLFILLTIFSCSSTQKVKYFQDIPDSGALKAIPKAGYTEIKIATDDILTVIVQTLDPTATQSINSGNLTVSNSPGAVNPANLAAAGQLNQPVGYLVDKDGDISMPLLGRIHVAGHTTAEVKDIVTQVAEKNFNHVTVVVRFSNFKVLVNGEVAKPGQYYMPNEKVSILDALSMAGDLTIFGKRENVLLIRENPDGTRTPYRINLKNTAMLSSPTYYLRQNDWIYVEPRKAKSDATDASQTKYITLASAVLSILLILAYRR